MPANTIYIPTEKKCCHLKRAMLAKRPAFENKCFNYMQWSRGSKQPFWKQLFTSQHGEACPLCGEDKRGRSARSSPWVSSTKLLFRRTSQPFSVLSLWRDNTHLCFCLTWKPVSIPMEPYETAEEDGKQKLLKVIEKRQQQTTLKIKEWKEGEANCAERLTTDTFGWKQWQPILSPRLEAQVGFLFHIRAPGS